MAEAACVASNRSAKIRRASKPVSLWVGNIPYQATESQLMRAFQSYAGIRSVKIITNRTTHASKGFGFVSAENDKEAQRLLDLPHGTIRISRRILKIKLAHSENSNDIRPGHKKYCRHTLSTEPYDLTSADPSVPSAHVLNDDVLLKIFRNLEMLEQLQLELVCRRWQGLVYSLLGGVSKLDFNDTSSNWGAAYEKMTEYTTCIERSFMTLCVHKALIMNSSSLTHISLINVSRDEDLLAAVAQLAPNLQFLAVSADPDCYYINLKYVVDRCPHLETIHVTGMGLNDNFIQELQKFKALKSVQLKGIADVYARKLDMLPKTLTELKIVNISLSEGFLKSIIKLRNLRKFHLYVTHRNPLLLMTNMSMTALIGCGTALFASAFTQEMLSTLAAKCLLLEDIKLVSAMERVPLDFSKFKHLQTLHLAAYEFDLRSFFKTCPPQLAELHLKFLNEESSLSTEIDFSSSAPHSLVSLTLPDVLLSEESYLSLTSLPNLRRVFFRRQTIGSAVFKKLVTWPGFSELGLHEYDDLTAKVVQEMSDLRRVAFREALLAGDTHTAAAAAAAASSSNDDMTIKVHISETSTMFLGGVDVSNSLIRFTNSEDWVYARSDDSESDWENASSGEINDEFADIGSFDGDWPDVGDLSDEDMYHHFGFDGFFGGGYDYDEFDFFGGDDSDDNEVGYHAYIYEY